METLLSWWPLLWLLRICLLVAGLAGIFLVGGYLLRFVRPKNIRALWDADMPRLRALRGNIEFMGQKLQINADLDNDRDEQIRLLTERLSQIREQQATQLNMIQDMANAIKTMEEGTDDYR